MDQMKRRDEGLLYLTDDALVEQLNRARRLTQQLNTIDRTDTEGITRIAKELLNCKGELLLNPPFTCDYGYRIEVGDHCLLNYNCTIIDVGRVKLGDCCLIGPNVAIYTAGHPIHPAPRNCNFTYGIDVEIGDNVWIGGNTVICPGVTIGSNTVIGAGSVVTRDIPAFCLAAGNPCRPIRKITEEDRHYYYKDRPIDNEAEAVIRSRIAQENDPRRYPVKEDEE